MSSETIKEQIFDNAEHYFERLITLIHSAKHSIYIETYIFDDDFVGQAIAEALESAALRGVRVRVLVDGVGAGWNFSIIAKQLNPVRSRGSRLQTTSLATCFMAIFTFSA